MSQHATHSAASGEQQRAQREGRRDERANRELLSLRGVHAHYGKSHILHGIDLAIGRGEVISLLAATAPAAPPP